MDTVLGVVYKGGVVLASDQSTTSSIIKYQGNADKIRPLSSHSAMAVSGPQYDMLEFSEYIEKNIKLYELANDGTKLSVHAQANFARSEVAAALRKGPYQVNVLLGGFDEKAGEPCLYTMDYTGSLHKVNFGVQGYASYFCLSLLDRVYESSNMTEEEAVAIIEQCIEGLNTRFLAAQPNFIIKAIDKDGTRIIKAGKDPTDT